MVNLINGLCYRAHPPVTAARPPRSRRREFVEPREFLNLQALRRD